MKRRAGLVSTLVLTLVLTVGLAPERARAAEPLRIGVAAAITGPGAESGKYLVQGAKLAADEVNKAGGVLGRPIEFVIQDDQSTNPGAVLAFSAVGGLIPGTLFALVVRAAPGEHTLSSTVGWIQQWSAFGQFAGPPAVAWLASRIGGWQFTWVATGASALLGLWLVTRIARLLAARSVRVSPT